MSISQALKVERRICAHYRRQSRYWQDECVRLRGDLDKAALAKQKAVQISKEMRIRLRIATPEDIEKWDAVLKELEGVK